MSDELNKHTLLVDQGEALDFYLDSLLSPQESDSAIAENTSLETADCDEQPLDNSVSDSDLAESGSDITDQDNAGKASQYSKLQAAKDFLQASKLRQQAKQLAEKTLSQPIKQAVSSDTAVSEAFLSKTSLSKIRGIEPLQSHVSAKTITDGPVSPKIRESERIGKKTINPAIIFSQTNKDGQLIEQVLIPRSQRPGALKKSPQPEKKAVIPGAQTVLSKEKRLPEEKNSVVKDVTATKEAPKLDLSFFLPKIKTLSDEEIAQQIEALTQVAVSQAQLESDLAHAAQMEQANIQTLKVQEGSCATILPNTDNAPSWAVPDFQVLLFAVAGLKLAVPLNELHGIVEWGDEYITELPGHASWYLGLIHNQGKNVPVVDTLQQVVPKKRWPSGHLSKRDFKHIILIDNGRWGLACETVLEVLTLKTDAVKWRSSRTRRRWLLGTVIEHMCALLDSAEFAAMLKTGDDSLLNLN